MFGFVSRKKYDADLAGANSIADAAMKNYDKQFVEASRQRDKRDEYKRQLDTANARLAAIIAMETPNCASIGKRMARVAKGLD